ncbi:MAG: anaerobic sulfatase maturase [Proteobacteria bacterium]|nr:anaerobic sulfatase maturase [Pseudomonadota bacterium]
MAKRPSSPTPNGSQTFRPLDSLLVKPAGPDCNLACGYCFYKDKAERFPGGHRMSHDVLENTIRQAMEQAGPEISVGWQGGEPTLMGLDFFQRAVAFEERYGRGQVVGNGLQTNGLLLDRKWAAFFRRYRFLIGLSLDGPEHVHDHYRRSLSGQGSWERAVGAARLLLDERVEVNALSVVNDHSACFPDEIYAFLKETGLSYMQFIPCVETDPLNPGRAAPFSVSAEHYGAFLCRVFDLWRADFVDGRPTTSIRFFDSVFYLYAGLTAPECTLRPECGTYLVVEHNGDVFACDFFVEDQWRLGSLLESRLVDLLNSNRQVEFGRIKSRLPGRCRDCRWLPLCRGGCPKDRQRDSRDKGVSHFCAAYHMFFQHADPFLRRLAREWKARQDLAQPAPSPAELPPGLKIGRNDPCFCGSGLKYKKCCGR